MPAAEPTDEPGAASGSANPWRGWRQGAALVLILAASIAFIAVNLKNRSGGDEVAAPPPASSTSANAQPKGPVYIALGDSLSRGVQPLEDRTLKRGYPRVLRDDLKDTVGVRPVLVEAGCGGATSTSMITAGRDCAPDAPVPYANENRSSSQLIWAVRELEARKALPTLVTLTIGGNDLTPCARETPVQVRDCLAEVLPPLKENWKVIARRLKAAAGPRTVLSIATTYDPILGFVAIGGQNARGARTFHRAVVRQVNPAMRTIFSAAGFEVADLAYAMHENGPIEDRGSRAVAAVCALTWACSRADVHLNDEGYAVAADVFGAAVQDRFTKAVAG